MLKGAAEILCYENDQLQKSAIMKMAKRYKGQMLFGSSRKILRIAGIMIVVLPDNGHSRKIQ